MIKAMVWKEWKETRLILAIFALMMLLCTSILIMNKKYEAVVFLISLNYFVMILLLSASLFTYEKESATLDFIIGCPVSWWKVFATKFLYGATVIFIFGIVILFGLHWLYKLSSLSPSTLDINKIGLACIALSIYSAACACSLLQKNAMKSFFVAFFSYPIAAIILYLLFVYIFYFKNSNSIFIIILGSYFLFLWKYSYILSSIGKKAIMMFFTLFLMYIMIQGGIIISMADPFCDYRDILDSFAMFIAISHESILTTFILLSIGTAIYAFFKIFQKETISRFALINVLPLAFTVLTIGVICITSFANKTIENSSSWWNSEPNKKYIFVTEKMYNYFPNRTFILDTQTSKIYEFAKKHSYGVWPYDISKDGKWVVYYLSSFGTSGLERKCDLVIENTKTGKTFFLERFPHLLFFTFSNITWFKNKLLVTANIKGKTTFSLYRLQENITLLSSKTILSSKSYYLGPQVAKNHIYYLDSKEGVVWKFDKKLSKIQKEEYISAVFEESGKKYKQYEKAKVYKLSMRRSIKISQCGNYLFINIHLMKTRALGFYPEDYNYVVSLNKKTFRNIKKDDWELYLSHSFIVPEKSLNDTAFYVYDLTNKIRKEMRQKYGVLFKAYKKRGLFFSNKTKEFRIIEFQPETSKYKILKTWKQKEKFYGFNWQISSSKKIYYLDKKRRNCFYIDMKTLQKVSFSFPTKLKVKDTKSLKFLGLNNSNLFFLKDKYRIYTYNITTKNFVILHE